MFADADVAGQPVTISLSYHATRETGFELASGRSRKISADA
jgi:hypothetical protein